MNDIEQRIASLPTPQASNQLDARMHSLFRDLTAESSEPASVSRENPWDTHDSRSSFEKWRNLMFRGLTVASACTVGAVILVGLITWLQGGSQVAFAQVVKSVEELETLQYLQTGSIVKAAKDEKNSPAPSSVSRTDIQKRLGQLRTQLQGRSLPQLQRQEFLAEVRVLEAFASEDSAPLISLARYRLSGQDRMRAEVVFPEMPVSITNGGKTVSLIEADKLAVIRTSTIVDQKGNPLPESPNRFLDLARVPESDIKRLPQKVVDGKSAIGFRRMTGPYGGSQTWWVDPKTKLPVRVEMRTRLSEGGVMTQMVFSDIVYNAPLDDALFDVSVPDGYEVKKQNNTFFFDTGSSDTAQ